MPPIFQTILLYLKHTSYHPLITPYHPIHTILEQNLTAATFSVQQ